MPRNRTHKYILTILTVLLLIFIPLSKVSAINRDDIVSQAAIMIDIDNGQVLFEKNADEKMYPASITKIMTALLALENCDLDEIITMSHEAVYSIPRDTSHISLEEGEQISLKWAMYAMMLPSANDAAAGIAEHVSGSMEAFCELMNSRARELGAKNTNFVNPHGLHDEDHYTTARDMMLITLEAIKHPEFCEIWGTETIDAPTTNKKDEVRHLWNQNGMITATVNHNDDVTGGKLGWTQEAGHTMVVTAERDGRRLLCVLMKSTAARDKYSDANKLFEYGFSLQKKALNADTVQNSDFVDILNEKGEKTGDVRFGIDDGYLLVEDGSDVSGIRVEYLLPENFSEGEEPQAKAVISLNGKELFTLDAKVVRKDDVKVSETDDESVSRAPQLKAALLKALKITAIVIGAFIVLLILLFFALLIRKHIILARRRRRKRKKRK